MTHYTPIHCCSGSTNHVDKNSELWTPRLQVNSKSNFGILESLGVLAKIPELIPVIPVYQIREFILRD